MDYKFHVVGDCWVKNIPHQNHSFDWKLLENGENGVKKDFKFIFKHKDTWKYGAVSYGWVYVPREVVEKAAFKILKTKKYTNKDGQEVEKSYPIGLISNKVIKYWQSMEKYKNCKFMNY